MKPDEISAFKQLLQLSNDRQYFFTLAAAGELSPVEQSSIQKIKDVDNAFAKFANTIAQFRMTASDVRTWRSTKVGTGTRDLSEKQFAEVEKLLWFVRDLDLWFQQTVFAAP